jgi:hypothetical protein
VSGFRSNELYLRSVGRNALGVATDHDILSPAVIEPLRTHGKFVAVSAGRDFASAVNGMKEIFARHIYIQTIC